MTTTPAAEAGKRAAIVAKRNVRALIVLVLLLIGVVYVWLGFNLIMAEVLNIPRAAPRSANVSHAQSVGGTLPFPTPWWVGALIAAGFAVLLATSWSREHQTHTRLPGSWLIVSMTPGTIVLATAFLALGSFMLAGYYTPGMPLSPWLFVAASGVIIAAVAQIHRTRQNREDRAAAPQRRRG